MKTTIIFVTLFALALLTSGCAKTAPQAQEFKIHSGFNGLSATIDSQRPPTQVQEQQLFGIQIDLKNQGAHPITRALYSISLEPGILELTGEDTKTIQEFDLPGKSAFYPEGETKQLILQAKSRDLPSQQETYTTNIALTLCYNYKTSASASVCIDTDLLGQQKTKPCTVSDVSLSGGQGAPVAVTSVSPKMLVHEDAQRVRPSFTITIQNRGSGKLFAKGQQVNACSARPLSTGSNRLWNRAEVRAFLSDVPLTCRPTDERGTPYVDLSKPSASVTCALDSGIPKTEGTYTSLLQVEVDYGYTFTQSRQVRIVQQS